jgi:hypothetical protein
VCVCVCVCVCVPSFQSCMVLVLALRPQVPQPHSLTRCPPPPPPHPSPPTPQLCEEILFKEALPEHGQLVLEPADLPTMTEEGEEHQPSSASNAQGGGWLHAQRFLFRGPRIKIGVDIGLTAPEISPITGRVTYRGKVSRGGRAWKGNSGPAPSCPGVEERRGCCCCCGP